jgi:hypothetical protein
MLMPPCFRIMVFVERLQTNANLHSIMLMQLG